MSHDLFQDVERFHQKFARQPLTTPGFLDPEAEKFRTNFLQEEFDEFKKALAERDLAEALDALIDLTWVALGTAHLMGLPFNAGWDEVVRANMSKVAATRADQSKRGYALDIVKPEGWRGPNIQAVIDDRVAMIEAHIQHKLEGN